MPEQIKFTQAELDELRQLQLQYQEKTNILGKIALDRKSLENLEEATFLEYKEIQNKEADWLKKITEKYGEGSLNLKDGTFTPNNG